MIHIYKDTETGTFSVFTDVSHLSEEQLKNVVSTDNPPIGNGDLKFDENKNIYLGEIKSFPADEEQEAPPTIEEQILTETKYQTVLLEMSTGF